MGCVYVRRLVSRVQKVGLTVSTPFGITCSFIWKKGIPNRSPNTFCHCHSEGTDFQTTCQTYIWPAIWPGDSLTVWGADPRLTPHGLVIKLDHWSLRLYHLYVHPGHWPQSFLSWPSRLVSDHLLLFINSAFYNQMMSTDLLFHCLHCHCLIALHV